ncbi:MAG: pyruvate kinase [Desulfobacterales bacterium]
MRKTKIICTIGPAGESSEVLRKRIDSGMNVARLYFSPGSHAEHFGGHGSGGHHQVRFHRHASVAFQTESHAYLPFPGSIHDPAANPRRIFAENPAEFDPRKYLGPARDELAKMVKHKNTNVIGSAGSA